MSMQTQGFRALAPQDHAALQLGMQHVDHLRQQQPQPSLVQHPPRAMTPVVAEKSQQTWRRR